MPLTGMDIMDMVNGFQKSQVSCTPQLITNDHLNTTLQNKLANVINHTNI